MGTPPLMTDVMRGVSRMPTTSAFGDQQHLVGCDLAMNPSLANFILGKTPSSIKNPLAMATTELPLNTGAKIPALGYRHVHLYCILRVLIVKQTRNMAKSSGRGQESRLSRPVCRLQAY